MTDAERAKRLAYSLGQIQMCDLFAQYWIAMANTGAATRQNIADGNGRQLTDEEKIDRALGIAKQHIHNLRETVEAQADLFPD